MAAFTHLCASSKTADGINGRDNLIRDRDHAVVFDETHLRRILAAYASYYNAFRTHLSLGKDSPAHRPIQQLGQLAARPILGGLHHQYCRI
jgi:transposase InsO family protein